MHPLAYLEGKLEGNLGLALYNTLLGQAATLLMYSRASPFNIEEAYGIAPDSGVVPLCLTHMNRLQPEQATILGVHYDYASEPLSGLSRPCPPGPGLHQRWEDCFPFPW
eukprot:8946200-Heterocapsa_arctica.AAC.1